LDPVIGGILNGFCISYGFERFMLARSEECYSNKSPPSGADPTCIMPVLFKRLFPLDTYDDF
jgi:hypothetical protein